MQPLTNNHGIIVATIIPQNKMVWTASDNTLMAFINNNFYWYSLHLSSSWWDVILLTDMFDSWMTWNISLSNKKHALHSNESKHEAHLVIQSCRNNITYSFLKFYEWWKRASKCMSCTMLHLHDCRSTKEFYDMMPVVSTIFFEL